MTQNVVLLARREGYAAADLNGSAALYGLSIGETRNERLPSYNAKPRRDGGRPCIRGLRVTVGAGRSIDELSVDYPYIEREDVLEALRYAVWRAEEREIDLAS